MCARAHTHTHTHYYIKTSWENAKQRSTIDTQKKAKQSKAKQQNTILKIFIKS